MRILILRFGAYGDMLVMTPLLRWLHGQGHEVLLNGTKQAEEILLGNPHVTFIPQTAEVPGPKFKEHLAALKEKHGADQAWDFSGSLEHRIAVSITDPSYVWPKPERLAKHNVNFYEDAFAYMGLRPPGFTGQEVVEGWRQFGGVDPERLRPEIFLTQDEQDWAERFFVAHNLTDRRVIVVCFTGSSLNKTYPYLYRTMLDWIDRKGKKFVLLSVGDNEGRLAENGHPRMIEMSAKCSFRQSVALLARSALYVGPDTGMLHASGCFDVPKVGIVGHHTREQITKHFLNDFSIYADPELCECSPCSRLVTDPMSQCSIFQVEDENGEKSPYPWCMGAGIPPARVVQRIEEALTA